LNPAPALAIQLQFRKIWVN